MECVGFKYNTLQYVYLLYIIIVAHWCVLNYFLYIRYVRLLIVTQCLFLTTLTDHLVLLIGFFLTKSKTRNTVNLSRKHKLEHINFQMVKYMSENISLKLTCGLSLDNPKTQNCRNQLLVTGLGSLLLLLQWAMYSVRGLMSRSVSVYFIPESPDYFDWGIQSKAL